MALAKISGRRSAREVLKADRTYFVRTDGSDTNDGLANTAVGAFLTIAKALATAASLDCSIYNLTVQVQAATWTTAVIFPKMIGSGNFTLLGDSATPANVVISTAAGHAVSAIGTVGTRWFLDGFKLQASGGGACAINAQDGGLIYYKNIEFGACTVGHVRAANGQAIANGNTTISGNALIHWFGTTGGYIFDAGFTITLTGTPAFANAFAQISDGAIAAVNNNTFVGTATGKKFAGASNGIIGATLGSDVNYLPGSLPGTLEGGAVYLGLMGGVREILFANRTYYVRTDGNDANTGLTNAAGGAFLTIQRAINVVANLDIGTYNVTIQVADGTYTGDIRVTSAWLGSGTVALLGNVATPANCIITSGVTVQVSNGGRLSINGFEIRATSIGASATRNGVLTLGANIRFGACTNYHWEATFNGIVVGASYSIVGAAGIHMRLDSGGVGQFAAMAITLSGTLAFTTFAEVTGGAILSHFSTTWTGGTITGQRYAASLNAVISVFGAGANVFPGSTAGAVATGGQYA